MPYVFDFDHTHARPPMELKDLLGGKGANLAEMTSVLALPVPPGLHHLDRRLPGLHGRRMAQEPRRRGGRGPHPPREGHGQGDRRRRRPPAWSRCAPGAKFSMPGMMDTVLNLGLNDRSVEGLAKQTGDERFAFDSYRRFIAMYGRIVLELPGRGVRLPLRRGQGAGRHHLGRQGADRAAALPGRLLPADRRAPHRPALPPGPGGAAARGHRGGLPQLERPPGHRLPQPGAHRARPGHRGQRAGHGVRQPRRQLGHRRRLHPRPGHRGQGRLRRLPGQRPGRGRGGGHPQHRAHLRAQEAVPRGAHASCWRSSPASRATTRTCATPSSPSTRASCGCCRPGWASAPARPP